MRMLVLAFSLAMGGCAGTSWEKAVYDGMRAGQPACARERATDSPTKGTANGPCQALPEHEAYERERRAARGGGGA